ncbi:ParB/RepB/Spo0J family partition protein [Sphingomonas sp. ABOLG]|uniref:ParB/RepB/Spo0J family partition protein n=2 Tax=Sphingomonadaceae TaxID=41297 RepID=UPI000F7DCE0E|nr:ParB/RepB/Spo0J family partition protein [Sphingomonas sp. ABOLG]RSV16237.1 ParB/RepB/Spo0J family partition protein [Sphingomonas sp. ABOLG]
MTQTVKLAKLKQSEKNVRTTPPKNIPAMAASISARGILQNLLVTPCKPRGMFEVIAGERRFLGAMMLAEAGEIVAADYDVPVKIVNGDDNDLREVSLTENFQREVMTPAEECRAFQHFLKSDGDIDAVAKRFGQTRRFIEGRLRLANLAEPIFEALANGEMTLDMAKAYGSTEDRAKQERVFAQYSHSPYINADQIRRAIANDTMKATDPVAVLVGADAYVAAGGRIERELFSEDGDRWSDPELAQTLAGAIMEAEAKRIGEEQGLAWIRPIATTNLYGATADLHRVPLSPAALSETEQARSDAIEERVAVLEEEMADEDIEEAAYAALEHEFDTLQTEYQELHSKPPVLPDEMKAQVGTFLMLDRNGKMVLETTYYSETPLRTPGDGTDQRPTGSTRDTSSLPPEAVAPGGKPLSARLHDELAVQRRDILAASILADPGLALDYALFAMVDRNRTYGRAGTTITAGRPNDPQMPADAKPTQAKIAIAEAREALDGSWTEGKTPVERFEAFRALDDDAKASWLAMIVADSLEAKQDYGAVTTNPLHARLAAILEVDVAKWWRPTCANFFDRVSKGTLLATLTEVGGATLAGRYLGSKKGEISTSCERLFAGEAITEAETKEAALAWVPDAMRFDATGATPIEEDTGDDEPSDEEDPADDEDLLEDGDDGDDSSGSGAVNDDAELVAAE